MKLSDYLSTLIGKEVTNAEVTNVMSMVTDIKSKAVKDLQAEVVELKTKNKEFVKNLSKYQEAEADGVLKDKFAKLGGNAEKFASFKKIAGKEELDDKAIKELIEEFPSLGAEAPKQEEQQEYQSNIFNQTQQQKQNDDESLPSQEGNFNSTVV